MHFFHFERKTQKVASRGRFSQRMVRNGAAAGVMTLLALLVGMGGYMMLEGMNATDAFANAALILSGMGPLDPLHTAGGRIFAGIYALVSGVLYIALSALILAPIFHRILHRFHVDEEDQP
jgi:glycerate kinase